MASAFREIYGAEGVKGFWRGILPALILVSNPVIQYTVFERLRVWLEKKRGGVLSAIDFFVLGAGT